MNESASSNITVGAETLRDLYVTMRRIRAFEDKTADLFQEGVVKGTAHSYKGEEAIAAGVCATLRDDDIIASYHRGHRPLHRQGRAHRPHDGGADGPPDRLLPGPRRLHAHRRHGAQHHGRERHRGRGHAARHRRRPRRQAARDGPGGGRLLRRRRLQPGRLPRIAQPGGGVEAAGDLRLREQPVRALHLLPEHHRRLPGLEPRGVPTRSPASPWTGTTASRSIWCCARRWTAPAPARGRR